MVLAATKQTTTQEMASNKREDEIIQPSKDLPITQAMTVAPKRRQSEDCGGSSIDSYGSDKLANYRKKIYMLNAKLKKRKMCIEK